MKISVIIPARNEIFLSKTVDDIFNKATGEIEVISVLDGYWPNPPIKERDNLIFIHRGEARGMRDGINSAVEISTGDWLMKCDAHCMFAEGWDEILKTQTDDNWIVIPRRHSLEPKSWTIEKNGKSGRDYHYLCMPNPEKPHDMGIHGQEWPERSRERANHSEYLIDDTPSFQGSCWFMKKTWFTDFLKGMNEHGYGTFSQEPQEIGMKTWLGGGEVKVNKNTWYAHLHKGSRYGRMYHIGKNEVVMGHNYSAWYWVTNQWKDRIYNFDWFVEKFLPMPTWIPDWKELLNNFWPEYGRKMGFTA